MDPHSDEALKLYGIVGGCLELHIECYRWAMATLSILKGFEEHIVGIHIANGQTHGIQEDVSSIKNPWVDVA